MLSKIDRREFLQLSGTMAGVVALPSGASRSGTARVRVVGLRADSVDNPLGLENRSPRLSWRLESDARNVRQTAYRVLVASSKDMLQAGKGDLWDTGKVSAKCSLGIRYSGRPLAARQQCFWCVQIWDERDVATGPSAPSWWEMGLLGPEDWTGEWLAIEDSVHKADREFGLQWIWGAGFEAPSQRRFRHEFELRADALSGQCFAIANELQAWVMGVWIDGVRIGSPENVDYSKWVDLGALRAGKHLLAVEVDTFPIPYKSAEATPRGDALSLFARIELKNGETVRIGSGPAWKTSLVQDPHWNTTQYDDASWETAKLIPLSGYQPWAASPAMYLRKAFSLNTPVRSARLYVTALGVYEARLNGSRVGDALLTPEISQYAKRVLYQVYDVTAMLQSGENLLGMTVGDGWYAGSYYGGQFTWGPPPRRALAQLEVSFADGSRQVVTTGPGWRIAPSAIRVSAIAVGEVYDARLDQAGWDRAEFDDAHWPEAEIAQTPPGRLVSQISPPIRATQVLKPQAISEPTPGKYVVDFGQDFTGWCRLRVKGARGTEVELRFSGWLSKTGEVEQVWLSQGLPKRDLFILKGAGIEETFEPHFTYRGFRYVQISGLPTPPTADSIEGVVIHSDLSMTGRIRSDSVLLEQIWRNTIWTQRATCIGVFVDGPCREQIGWLGDAVDFWDAAAFNMDICAFTSRRMDDVVDGQSADGAFPMAAPVPRYNNSYELNFPGASPAFSDGGCILPWTAWRRYGDLGVVERNWDAMNRYVQFILNHNPDYIWRNNCSIVWGDWAAPDQSDPSNATSATPGNVIATAFWAHSVDLLAQMSQAVGRVEDADRLRNTFERIRQAFGKEFVRADGVVATGSQACYILALHFGLLPEDLKSVAAERLAEDVRRHGVALTTGIVATPYSLDALADAGFSDLVYGLLLRTKFPSWGYMIRHGATTIWENWSGELDDVGVNDRGEVTPTGKKLKVEPDHAALGCVVGFLFRRFAGIDAAAPGFEHIIVRPIVDPRVKKGGGDYDSAMGRISTDWECNADGRFTLSVTIPANASARIHLPTGREYRITEGRRVITQRREMRIIDRLDHEAVIEVGSGTYRFVASKQT